jgi:hypothetical protein
MSAEPLTMAKQDCGGIFHRLSVPDSPVGIDAQDSQAIMITYLQRTSECLDRIEAQLQSR